jgi:hypothetical protein
MARHLGAVSVDKSCPTLALLSSHISIDTRHLMTSNHSKGGDCSSSRCSISIARQRGRHFPSARLEPVQLSLNFVTFSIT